jgi:hypothetical protein
MTKLNLTIETDGTQVANLTAEVSDFQKLREVAEAIVTAFADKEEPPVA